jgi:hypothetical protein
MVHGAIPVGGMMAARSVLGVLMSSPATKMASPSLPRVTALTIKRANIGPLDRLAAIDE